MKNKLLLIVALFLCFGAGAKADDLVNLTPRPKSMTVGTGSLTLPETFTISCNALPADMKAEVERFAAALQSTTGCQVSVTDNDATALFQFALPSSTLKESAYTAQVTAEGVSVTASTALGTYYACQTLKKILPANVMAGVNDAAVSTYALPVVKITDEPRFQYRGFMLDVARHFFTVNEVKRMLDVMSYYKMNRFHWHLTDDQGWRVEIKKYPLLTKVASTAPNSLITSMEDCGQYWLNKPYGPYFYTQDEIRDVVAYAKERHIEIVPEIDMPGHFSAALAAYPAYSCTPSGSHTVATSGGIYSDVLNVANAEAVQFAKDILKELMDLFPGEIIHIGGDECPVTAWQANADCQKLYNELGLTSYRQLQSHFIEQLSTFAKENGRQIAVWNEGITADGADLNIMKATGATVYCWNPADASATKAKQLGLPNVYTVYGPYYINRKQGNSELDPPGAGNGSDDVKATYNQAVPSATDYGVQGTFWTENVSDANYMEWLALPRLLAIAESGWTQASRKSFTDFQKRMTADTTLLNYGNYRYCKYHMVGYVSPSSSSKVMPKANTSDKKYYYRLVSGGTDDTRKNRCIELIATGSPLITTYSGKGAKAGVLWTNTQATSASDTNYDYQWWSIEEDPANAGKYALVCKAMPDGSVNPTPTAVSTSGRWNYDSSAKHYNFELGTGAYGQKGSNYYYTIASDKVSGQYFNSSMSGQGLAVNLYTNPNDGAGGQWEFAPMEDYGQNVQPVTFPYLEEGRTYSFTNAVDGYDATAIADNGTATALQHSTDAYASNAWTVEKSTVNADGSQTLKLRNAVSGRYISGTGSFTSRLGTSVTLAKQTTASAVTLSCDVADSTYCLKVSGKGLFPVPSGAVNAGSTTSSDADAIRSQGARWNVSEVRVVTYLCEDEAGRSLGTFTRSLPATQSEIGENDCPALKNHSFLSVSETEESGKFTVRYKRTAYSLTYNCTLGNGAIVERSEVTVSVGETAEVTLPAPKYYTLASSDVANGTSLTLTADITVNALYTTDAIIRPKADADVATSLENGKSYLFYDATDASGRAGYRTVNLLTKRINRETSADNLSASAIWTLEGSGKTFKVKNAFTDLYVPQLEQSQPTTASKTGANFTFTLNADGTTWNIKGTNGEYWDGLESGDLVGWNGGTGHPIRITTFFAQPVYTVNVECVTAEGETLYQLTENVDAGTEYPLTALTFDGYTLKSTQTEGGYVDGRIEGYTTVTLVYEKVQDGIHHTTVDSSATPRGIFDLQGRRLQSIPQRGIYIVNGQKVIVK